MKVKKKDIAWWARFKKEGAVKNAQKEEGAVKNQNDK